MCIRKPEIGEMLICEQEFENLHNPYAILIVHNDSVFIGHVP